ncbi:MAG: tetratricopeptide repeat protein [Parvibaculaceae bacterium]|jgi:TPR repeat protein
MTRIFCLLLCLLAATPALAQASYEEAVLLYEDKDYKGAREIAEAAAKKGDARAMAMLGLFYQKGYGVGADLNKAVDWYAGAAEKNNVDAQYALADIYLGGALGEPDMERGRYWLIKAAGQGRPEAEHRLGLLAAEETPPDWTSAADWFRKAAAQGYPDAQYNLGVLYSEGKGVEQSKITAGEWFAKAAMKGHPDAALDYGIMVFRGDGVKKDEKVGAQWLMVSAKRGNPVAQNRVARLYATGRVFPVDPAEAMKWHILARQGGRSDAWLDDFTGRLPQATKTEAEKRARDFKPD